MLTLYTLASSLTAIYALERFQIKHRFGLARIGLIVGLVNATVIVMATALFRTEAGDSGVARVRRALRSDWRPDGRGRCQLHDSVLRGSLLDQYRSPLGRAIEHQSAALAPPCVRGAGQLPAFADGRQPGEGGLQRRRRRRDARLHGPASITTSARSSAPSTSSRTSTRGRIHTTSCRLR